MKTKSRSIFLALFSLIILASLACSLSAPNIPAPFAPPPTATPTPLPLPPAVAETIPYTGSQISTQQTIFIYFNQAMERTSVASALTVEPAVQGLWNWMDDSILTFTPVQSLAPDTTLKFTLAASAKAANGLPLSEPQTFAFKTYGPFNITQTIPANGASDVSPAGAVSVSFNQPVVALGADAASLPAAFSLEPVAQGRGEWINTSTYIFYPEPALSGGIDYTVRIDPQLVSAAGVALNLNGPATNATFSFRTSLPRIINTTPDPSLVLGLTPELKIDFNQPMDADSVRQNFTLSGPNGPVDGSFTWNDTNTSLTFKPLNPLQRAAVYNAEINSRAQSRGGAPLESGWQASYSTYPDFGVYYTNPAPGGTKAEYDSVQVIFTAPPQAYTGPELKKLISISPSTGDFDYYISEETTLNVYGYFDADSTYSVTISGSMADKWGQPIGSDYTFSFYTGRARAQLTLPMFQVIFARPEEPVVDVQQAGITTINASMAPISFDDFFRLNGPDGYNYQQSFTPSGQQQWPVAVEYSGKVRQMTINLSPSGETLAPGLYTFTLTSPQADSYQYLNRQYLLTSNVNLTIKANSTEALVWAVDVRNSQPVAGQPVTLRDSSGTVLASGVTDSNGLWKTSFAQTEQYFDGKYAVMGQPGDEFFSMAASSWSMGTQSYDFGIWSSGSGPTTSIYLYTDRPIYRPGNTLFYRGAVREAFNGRYSLTNVSSMLLKLYDVNGSTVGESEVPVSAYGTFDGRFDLSASATPGGYSLQAAPKGSNDYGTSLYFDVADYRKPEINLSAGINPGDVRSGQPLTGVVHAEYFFGSPTPNLPIEWKVYSNPAYFDIPGYQTGLFSAGWLYYDSTFGGRYGLQLASGSGVTDKDGNLSVSLEGFTAEELTTLTFEATASESGGYPVSARGDASLHPAAFYIGLRPNQWVGQAGTPLGFSIQTAAWDQKPVGGKTLDVKFQKVTWQESGGDLYRSHLIPVTETLETKTVTVSADGKAEVSFTPTEAGTFMLDVSGEGARSQQFVWVGGSQQAIWPQLPLDRLQLTVDRDEYKPGETASVFIPNEFGTPALALVTTERGKILSERVVNIPAGGGDIDLALTEGDAPNVYVAVTLLGPGTSFRMGYKNLKVDPGALTLNVELSATPQKASPGDPLTIDLRVTDNAGQPVQAQFSLSVVDLAVLALADPNYEDIVPFYYKIQPLGVFTGLTDSVYGRRFIQFAGGRGGGGGGDITTVRENFPDTSYWKADIETDAQGKAQVTFNLPDNLTTWQIDTRGLTKDTKVGQAIMQIVTTKDLLIRPVTPRFFVAGDHALLAALVNNNTSSELNATVSLEATGFSLDDAAQASQKVSVPANGRARVEWWGKVQDGEAAKLVFSVKAGELEDASTPVDGDIPILTYSAPQTFATAGLLADAGSRLELVSLPRSFNPLGGQLDVEISPSLGAYLFQVVEKLEEPDQNASNEQIASYILTNLSLLPALRQAGIPNDVIVLRQQSIQSWARKLTQTQNVDGGWSWFHMPYNYEAKSDPMITAHVILAISQAQQAQLFNVPDVISRANNDFLSRILLIEPTASDSDLDHITYLAYASFMARQVTGEVVGGSGRGRIFLDELYDLRERLNPASRAMLAMAYQAIDGAVRPDLLDNLQNSAIRSATGVNWESSSGDWSYPGTPLYTTSVVVTALAKNDPASTLLPDAVRYLIANRSATRGWRADMETAWLAQALSVTMLGWGEFRSDYAFSASLNGTKLAEGQAAGTQNPTTILSTTPLAQMYLTSPNALIFTREAGAGRMYYRALLSVHRPVETAPALNKGIAVSREFLDCSSGQCKPITSWQMTSDPTAKVKVRVTVTLPHDVYYFNVQDYIPAGAEILNATLKTSQQGEESTKVEVYDPENPYADGWGWWYFGQPHIYRDHILWNADYLPSGTYSLTYTIIPSQAGEYRVLPAHAWLSFFPEVEGTSTGSLFEIKP
jgi:uncharacterized protein YfaS (alpha-2-macroglobulin family)